MKKILTYILIGTLAFGATSCKKLDINDNPNSPTSATPGLVLPQALVGTASIANNYNISFAYPGGFFANVYGFGAYGATVTLNYSTTNFTGLWSSSYDNATDYQYVIDNTSADATLIYSNSIARIMKSYIFAKLVDQYNDVPYTDALKGSSSLNPKYDTGSAIYQDLVAQLNTSIAAITAGQASITTTDILASADPMFAGKMDLWKKFANTLKLKLLIKMAAVPALSSFTTAQFAAFDNALGVITDDALVNPGYLKQAGRVSPAYLSLAANETDVRSATSSLPTIWIYSFYNGTKLRDQGRGAVIYREFPNTATNQLGREDLASNIIPPSGSTAWYTGADFATPGLGVAKGPSQGSVVMLLAEAKFLQAEAIARGYLPGNATEVFDAGIAGSFSYLFKNQTGVVDPSKNVSVAVAKYHTDNIENFLVNLGLAASNEQRIEAIITQKYIAMNVINCDEAFAEFRRTGYPRIVNGSTSATATFASTQSVSTSPDKLITRLPYPQEEYTLNPSNVPQNINIFQAKIFWDLN